METGTGLESSEARQVVLHLLERAERRLARAMQAVHADDQNQLLQELVALACLAHMSTNVARSVTSSASPDLATNAG